MNSPSQALVHHVLASYLQIDDTLIEDAQTFDELGLEPLDLVFVVLRLEDLDRGDGDFPLEALEHAKTVADLVLLVEIWVQRDTLPSMIRNAG